LGDGERHRVEAQQPALLRDFLRKRTNAAIPLIVGLAAGHGRGR